MESNNGNVYKKPNWMILKEAAEELVRMGKTSFTRKELTKYAKKLDPSRPETSLDFEIDLVTVNSNSKDRYRDPDKLFLFRIARGRYTLYDPETHGPLEKYLEQHRFIPTRKYVLSQVIEDLQTKGFEAHENRYHRKPLAPDIIAKMNGKKIGVWVIDPSIDPSTQMKALAYAIGSSLLNTEYDEHIITVPSNLANKIKQSMLNKVIDKLNIKIAILKEKKQYVIEL